MGPVAIAFGVAATATVALTLVTRGWRHRSFHLALMMLGFWGLANVSEPWMDPIIDAAGFYTALLVWWNQAEDPTTVAGNAVQSGGERCIWPLLLALVFLTQQISHFVLGSADKFDRQLALNVLFAVALFILWLPCADRPIRSIRRSWASGHRTRRSPVVVRSDEG